MGWVFINSIDIFNKNKKGRKLVGEIVNKKNIFLIDGGMGQELIHRSKIKPDGLWGARVLLDNYELVVDLHKDFIEIVENSRGSKLKKTEVELFSGEFWSGRKAKDLGLIDGVGDANQILREKFGEDVVIKKFEKSKSWLSKKISSSSDHVDQLANILDEKSVWQRYGL